MFFPTFSIDLNLWTFDEDGWVVNSNIHLTFMFLVLLSTVFIFLLALVGVFYPYNRGALFTALVVIYALTSGIAGYTATSFYCQLEGTNWVRAPADPNPLVAFSSILKSKTVLPITP